MTEAVAASETFDPRLARIDFPRVDVEDVRLAATQDPIDSAAEDRVRDQAEVPSPAPGQTLGANVEAGDAGLVKAGEQLDNRLARLQAGQSSIAVVHKVGKTDES